MGAAREKEKERAFRRLAGDSPCVHDVWGHEKKCLRCPTGTFLEFAEAHPPPPRAVRIKPWAAAREHARRPPGAR